MKSVVDKFLHAQAGGVYELALQEIEFGEKQSHWMWFIFPQIKGLGFSFMSRKYEFQDFDEAREYFSDETLRERLLQISQAVYDLDADDIGFVFGYPDDSKFCSCMTLFALITPEYEIFKKNIDRYYNGNMCEHTLNIFREETT